MTNTAKLKAARGKFARRLTIKDGSQRDFWEAGYNKASKDAAAAAAAYAASPEGIAEEEKRRAIDREFWADMVSSLNKLNAVIDA